MKQIVLIDQGRDYSREERCRLIQQILATHCYRIVLLVLNPTEEKDVYSSIEGVEDVIDSREIEYAESMKGIDFDTIEKCRDMQMHIEGGYLRAYGDYQLDKYAYYAALSFWEQFFRAHRVDIVIQLKPFHGFCYDVCDLVARQHGVPFFHVDFVGYNKSLGFYTANRINRFILRPVFHHSCKDILYLLDSDYDKSKNMPTKIKKSPARRFLYDMGGNLLEDFMTRLVRFDWTPRHYIQKRKKISWSDKFFGYYCQKRVQHYLQTLFCTPDYEEKYICYFLHVEPEATIQNTTVIDSQLVVIKMLSDTLPDGWFIYVKDHPAQYDINNDVGYYHMWDGQFFKTKAFYEKLASIPHVKIVPTGEPSSKMVEHSAAVASITGTVLLESVLKKKPVLVFSELSPVTYMKDSFFVQSYDDCERALQQIVAGIEPQYLDADEMVQKYAFQGEYMAENIVALLQKECLGPSSPPPPPPPRADGLETDEYRRMDERKQCRCSMEKTSS